MRAYVVSDKHIRLHTCFSIRAAYQAYMERRVKTALEAHVRDNIRSNPKLTPEQVAQLWALLAIANAMGRLTPRWAAASTTPSPATS